MPMTMFDMIEMALKGIHDPNGSDLTTIKTYLDVQCHFSCKGKKNLNGLLEGLRKAVGNGVLELHEGRYKITGHQFPSGSVPWVYEAPKRMTKKKVHDLLRGMGVEKPESVSSCLKGGIQRGHIKVNGNPQDLEKVILRGRIDDYGYECEHEVIATIGNLLYQPDYGGHDYENCSEDATARCTEVMEDGEECMGRMYVTGLCQGQPEWNSGKSHYHCEKCTRKAPFGVCVGDYRQAHCDGCSRHYFAGCSVSSGCGNPACVMYKRDSYGDHSDDDDNCVLM